MGYDMNLWIGMRRFLSFVLFLGFDWRARGGGQQKASRQAHKHGEHGVRRLCRALFLSPHFEKMLLCYYGGP
jgi:hypothetical protein